MTVIINYDLIDASNNTSYESLKVEVQNFVNENKDKPLALLIYCLNLKHSLGRYVALTEKQKEDTCEFVWGVLQFISKNRKVGSGIRSDIPVWFSDREAWENFRDGFFK